MCFVGSLTDLDVRTDGPLATGRSSRTCVLIALPVPTHPTLSLYLGSRRCRGSVLSEPRLQEALRTLDGPFFFQVRTQDEFPTPARRGVFELGPTPQESLVPKSGSPMESLEKVTLYSVNKSRRGLLPWSVVQSVGDRSVGVTSR